MIFFYFKLYFDIILGQPLSVVLGNFWKYQAFFINCPLIRQIVIKIKQNLKNENFTFFR